MIIGVAAYHRKYLSKKTIGNLYLKAVTFLSLIFTSFPIFLISATLIIFNVFSKSINNNININRLNKKRKNSVRKLKILMFLLALFLLFFIYYLVSQEQIITKVLSLLGGKYTENKGLAYAERIEALRKGSGFQIFSEVSFLNGLVSIVYFNFLPFFSLYFLALYISSKKTKYILIFLPSLLLSFIISLSTLGKARIVVYLIQICWVVFLFLNINKKNKLLPFLVFIILFIVPITLIGLFFTYIFTGYSSSFIDSITSQIERIFFVPIYASYAWFLAFPDILDHPGVTVMGNITSSLFGFSNTISATELVLEVARKTEGFDNGIVANFIASSYGRWGAFGILFIIQFVLVTIYLERMVNYTCNKLLIISVYAFEYGVLITAINVSIDNAVYFFGVWLIPILALFIQRASRLI
jgi:oligosaccharide repeat unit polymerase